MCTFEPEKPEASVDRGARELPLSPGHDPSKTSSFLACNKRYVKCIKRFLFSSPVPKIRNLWFGTLSCAESPRHMPDFTLPPKLLIGIWI